VWPSRDLWSFKGRRYQAGRERVRLTGDDTDLNDALTFLVRRLFSVASPVSFLSFVAAFRRSASDLFSYPSRFCLPLYIPSLLFYRNNDHATINIIPMGGFCQSVLTSSLLAGIVMAQFSLLTGV
jgi:hypothetical protein